MRNIGRGGVRILAGLLLVLGLGVPARGAPRIVCDQPAHHFGTAYSTDSIQHDFILRNEGDEPLEIGNVRADCGCTAAAASLKTVPAGGQTVIKSTLSLKGRQGRQRKTVTVESNDPAAPRYQLHLEGEVAPDEVTLQPSRLTFMRVPPDQVSTASFLVKIREGATVEVLEATSTSPRGVVTLEPVTPGREYKATVALQPPLAPGHTLFVVHVRTDHPRMSLLEVPIVIYVDAPAASPPTGHPPSAEPAPAPAAVVTPLAPVAAPLHCSEPVHDVGRVDNRLEVAHAFEIENRSDRKLLVQVVDHTPEDESCGPHKVNLASAELEPGMRGKFRVAYDLRGRVGRFAKAFLVESSLPNAPQMELKLTGEATPVLRVSPREVSFETVPKDSNAFKDVAIASAAEKPLVVRRVESRSPHFTAELGVDAATRSHRVRVTAVPPLPVGQLRGEVEIELNDAVEPVVKVPVFAWVAEPIETEPEEIVLSGVATNAPQHVFLRSRDRTFGIQGIEPPPGMKAQVSGAGTRLYRLTLTVPDDLGDFTGGALRVKTTVESQPEVVVPIRVVRE